MKKCLVLAGFITIICSSCSGPTKAGKEARVNAHRRMDIVNADLAAQQAKQQFEVGQLDAAEKTIDAAIARFNENGSYYLLRGRILLEQHQLDASYVAFQQAVTYSPELSEPHYFLGVLHQRWAEDNEALKEYILAMELDSSHPQYLLAAAESYVALGKQDEAIELLQNASQEFQHQPTVASLMGHIHLSQGNHEEATRWLEDSRMLGNDHIGISTTIASAQFHAKKYGDCLITLVRLEDQTGELSPVFQRMRGKCLASTGRVIQGRDICLRITRETPDDVGAWKDLGYIAWDMGDYERLGRCGTKISHLDANAIEGQLFQGIAAVHSGNMEVMQDILSKLKSDNDTIGIRVLLENASKSAKLRTETVNTPNMPSNSAEGSVDQQTAKLAIVGTDSNETP